MVHADAGAAGGVALVGGAHGTGGQVLGEVESERAGRHVLVVRDGDGNLPPLRLLLLLLLLLLLFLVVRVGATTAGGGGVRRVLPLRR